MILHRLRSKLGPDVEAPETFDSSKLYGLYRSRENQIVFKHDNTDKAEHMACAYGGLQKLLNMNEAALDITSDLQPSLG